MRKPLNIILFAALAAILSLAGCDESLPPRDEPLAILRGSFAMTDTFIVVTNGAIGSTAGGFVSRVTNLYNDVLEDTGLVKVDYTVVMEDQPEHVATFTATQNNVLSTEVLNGRLVTLKPNQDIVVRYRWNNHTSADLPIWSLVTLHPGSDPGGRAYLQSDPVSFQVTCSIRTYKRVPAIVIGPKRIIVIYRIM